MDGTPWGEFLNGPDSAPHGDALAAWWEQTLHDSNTIEELAADHRIVWADLPRGREVPVQIHSGSPHGDRPVDVVSLACRQMKKRWREDLTFSPHAPRPLPRDLVDLAPGDAGSLRAAMVPDHLFEDADYDSLSPAERFARVLNAATAVGSYLAVPHFIPAPEALDVVTTDDLDHDLRRDLRLPAPWTFVVHDPVAATLAAANDANLSRILEEGVPAVGREPAVAGALLKATDAMNLRLDTRLGFLLVTSLDERGDRTWWTLNPAKFGTHPAGRIMFSYAAQLTFARWNPPPPLPDREGRADSNRALRAAARSTAGQQGGWHGVRVLDMEPPPDEPSDSHPNGEGQELTFGTWRRAHWRPRVRVGIRDADDRLVGPVYKTGVLGETYTYARKFVRRTRIRPDLPLRQEVTGEGSVYRLRGRP